ncbi:hypothetical protein BB560_003624 [Smittium megazygosporum]|uniref:Arrestin-like N-terminal domain-containing protein n=1 Tax=Smittium megazygosporum TaxID=133381 RepID=A0A2T9ZBH7_9FUNG|nr:hypothetical protein BB560_003624 [Smittium megazygosporum]
MDSDIIEYIFSNQSDENEVPIFQPDDEMKFKVLLTLKESMIIGGIELILTGFEKSVLNMKSIGTNKMGNAAKNKGIKSLGLKLGNRGADVKATKKVYFRKTANLADVDSKEGKAVKLKKGQYEFPVELRFPLANFPQSVKAREYEISYVLQTVILPPGAPKPRKDQEEKKRAPIASKSISLEFVPKVRIDIMNTLESEHFYFCDNVYDTKENKLVYHIEAISMQKEFKPGGNIEIQIKMTGKKTLFKTTAMLVEQIDGFYPASPNTVEGFVEMSDRIWSKKNILTSSGATNAEVIFETKNTTPVQCYKHGDDSEPGFTKEFLGSISIGAPMSVYCLPETYYLRITYYISISGYMNSSWGGTRNFEVKIPVVFSNISKIKERALVMNRAARQPGAKRMQGPGQQQNAMYQGMYSPNNLMGPNISKDNRRRNPEPKKGNVAISGMLDPSAYGMPGGQSPRTSSETVGGSVSSSKFNMSADDGSAQVGELFSQDFAETLFKLSKYNNSSNNKQMYRSRVNSERKNVVPLGFAKVDRERSDSDGTYKDKRRLSGTSSVETVVDLMQLNPSLLPEITSEGETIRRY